MKDLNLDLFWAELSHANMPPKKDKGPSAKTENKKKEKVIEVCPNYCHR